MVDPRPDTPRKGRGALSNRSGRYETHERVAVDDGWQAPAGDDDPAPLRTSVGIDSSRTVIARNASPDVPFDRSINPYRGCEHGCVYCFARPSHAFLGLSPGLDFETRLFAKPEAARLLEAELARPSYRPAVIALGTNTDPYQPLERRLGITRQVLEVLRRARHPVAIVTKSNLVERDLDILAEMAAERLVRVLISVTTLDSALARKMEPRAPRPALRLAAVRRLAQAGVCVGVLAAPMIPALNDAELEAILEAAAAAGADSASYVLLRLPLEIKDLFAEWLATHFPDRKDRVLSLLRQTRGGRLYDPQWGARMKGRGPYAELLARRFELACHRFGLNRADWDLDASRFARPRADSGQLALF
jgi:DNA repair photolyase